MCQKEKCYVAMTGLLTADKDSVSRCWPKQCNCSLGLARLIGSHHIRKNVAKGKGEFATYWVQNCNLHLNLPDCSGAGAMNKLIGQRI